ncbi:MAG TPA: hypothetical protein VHW91_06490 [Candidatus Dormibacteraeota bacterium]|nr:hypothetical protein [Candidatus Dormibacteraeota bacterium]
MRSAAASPAREPPHRYRSAGDERRYQRALRLEEGDDGRPDPRGCDQPADLVLDGAIDPQERSGFRGNPQDIGLLPNDDPEVPVGNSPLERLDLADIARPAGNALDHAALDHLSAHPRIA